MEINTIFSTAKETRVWKGGGKEVVAVGTEQADGARGWHESEGDRRIGLLAGRIPRHIFLPDTRGIQRSHFSAPLYASYIRIYYPPNTYLHPANKLIHYSTEQSSSFLSLPSLFSRRRRRRRRYRCSRCRFGRRRDNRNRCNCCNP